MAVTSMIGARIQRREDPKLITGHGNFIDDVNLVNMAHMSIVRSPHAHARIRSIDTSAARAAKGVVAVLTAADFKSVIHAPLPVTNSFVADKKQVPEQFAIAADEVVYAGEPVAVVIAEDRYLADDAAQLVVVDYEPLPAVMDLEKAMAPGSPLVKSDRPDNIGWDAAFPAGDIDAVFAEAEVVLKQRIGQQRLFPTPMETRGCVADYVPVRQPRDALDVDAGAALRPALRRWCARRPRVAVPGRQPRRRWRIRLEDPAVPRRNTSPLRRRRSSSDR